MIKQKITNFKKEITVAKTMYARDFYKFYEIRSKKKKKIKEVSYTVYWYILTSFFNKLLIELTERSYIYKIPSELGFLKAVKRKTKGVIEDGEFKMRSTTYFKDWKKTKESRKKEGNEVKVIYNLDLEYKISLKWIKGRVKNINYHFLKPSYKVGKVLYDIALNGKHNKIDEESVLHNRESK